MSNLINLLKTQFLSNSPYRILHLITSKCNCKCQICNLWKKSPEYINDLSTEKIFKMLEDAKKAGMVVYTAMGGEPLLREDLPSILKYAKKLEFITSVVTNGYYLKEKHVEILPHTDVLSVSIDSNDDLHDKIRGVEGIRERAIEGIKLCKNSKTKIIINSIISNLNLDKTEGLLELAKELNVSISLQPMDILRGYNEDLEATELELQKAFINIIKFKKAGYPIINSIQYLQNFSIKKNFTCHAPKCFINVEANGDLSSCLNVHDKIWGNVRNTKFKELFGDKDFKEFCRNSKKCNVCNVACVIESSLGSLFNPKFLLEQAFSYGSLL